MHTHTGTLYPMLGVGAFMAMFWTGIVVGHELGLGCATLLITGLLSACLGTLGVCELQRRDGHPPAAMARKPAPLSRRAAGDGGVAGRTTPLAARGRQAGSMTIGRRSLPIGSS
jgi:hypothetical protein